MKKFLLVLLAIAVAGGVFALDGEWSLSSHAEVGTIINLDPDVTSTVDNATIEGTQYNMPYDGWNAPKGRFGMTYNYEGLSAGLTFSSNWGDGPALKGEAGYGGENFYFHASSDFTALIGGAISFDNLWGKYEFLNNIILLEASYARGWTGNAFWTSDTTAGIANWNGYGFNPISGALGGGDRNTFVMTDGGWSSNYLVANVQLSGLSFGAKLKDIFWINGNPNTANDPAELIEDVLKKMILGVKFEMTPIEVAAQFLMEDYGIYLGAKWFVGPVTVGLSFMGIMDAPTTVMKVGAGVDYAADQFGAGLKGYFGKEGDNTVGSVSEIGVEPYFYYNVIPTHLQFRTDLGFYFFNGYDPIAADDLELKVRWALQPQLFWNFLGTGAGGYGGTGIAVRYRLVSGSSSADAWEQIVNGLIGTNNKLDVCFRWSF